MNGEPGEFMTEMLHSKRPSATVVEASSEFRPKTFDDIPAAKTTARCSRCGKSAPFKFTMYIKPNGRSGTAVISRTYTICESCGAFLVYEIQKVLEK